MRKLVDLSDTELFYERGCASLGIYPTFATPIWHLYIPVLDKFLGVRRTLENLPVLYLDYEHTLSSVDDRGAF